MSCDFDSFLNCEKMGESFLRVFVGPGFFFALNGAGVFSCQVFLDHGLLDSAVEENFLKTL